MQVAAKIKTSEEFVKALHQSRSKFVIEILYNSIYRSLKYCQQNYLP